MVRVFVGVDVRRIFTGACVDYSDGVCERIFVCGIICYCPLILYTVYVYSMIQRLRHSKTQSCFAVYFPVVQTCILATTTFLFLLFLYARAGARAH